MSIRKFAAFCISLALISPAWAQTAVRDLASAPGDATRYEITSSGGKHGEEWQWTTPDGAHWSRFTMTLRGFQYDLEQKRVSDPSGRITALTIRGATPEGDAGETFSVADGRAIWKSPVDSGAAPGGGFYVPYGVSIDANAALTNALLAAPANTMTLLPSGQAKLEKLVSVEVSAGGETKTLDAYVVLGLGLSPQTVWTEKGKFFGTVGVLSFLPAGWKDVAPTLNKAQDDALAARAPGVAATLARTPSLPVVFQNVRLFDADARVFKDAMTVIVENGRIAAVGGADQIALPAAAEVYQGAGRTLVPGLWDNHQHFGDDSTGLLLLAQGITSVRDPGNQVSELLARKARIESGALLGPRIVASMLIDGPGPFAAQVATIVATQDEAIAAVRKAKELGYFGIKLYGSLNPKFVAPMASEADRLGLRVHGHIPRGMRPREAVRAGYDEITHINWVMMEAMPDGVIRTSNGLNRFYGPGRYGAGVDLQTGAMKRFLDELAARGVAVDPTMAIFETMYTTDQGEVSPSYQPFLGTLPPAVERGFRAGGIKPEAAVTRARMRESFAKIQELLVELAERNVAILAGTDGYGIELVRDLELYVAAGLSPADALATATIEPAKSYGLGGETGSLALGKKAELALVAGDPSKTIGDLRHVEIVMRDGKIMNAADLRAAIGISGPPK